MVGPEGFEPSTNRLSGMEAIRWGVYIFYIHVDLM